jgi:hypothetical protein
VTKNFFKSKNLLTNKVIAAPKKQVIKRNGKIYMGDINAKPPATLPTEE